MSSREHPRRRRLLGRRPPAVHRPALPAPETPEEVLGRACCCATLRPGESCPAHPFDPSQYVPAEDVSRETWAELEAALEGPAAAAEAELLPHGRYVAGGQVPAVDPELAPPLRKEQVAKLEALTAIWNRQVRLEGPADATMLYAAPRLPPVPPAKTPAPGPAPAPALREPVPGQRVSDWASRHDPRSLEFAVRRRLATRVPLADVLLEHGPILDQGTTPPLTLADASACVGMASVAAANVLELAGGSNAPHHGPNGGLLMEEDARELYARAQELDGVDAAAGTSVLAGMKAGREAGWWDTYLWALGGTQDVAQVLLQLRVAVVIGIPWDSSLEEPDAAGIIRPGGTPAGGHSLAVVGLQRAVAGQPGPYFVLQQSRGTSEGVGGLVYVHHRHLAQLLGGVGEAAVPLPAGSP